MTPTERIEALPASYDTIIDDATVGATESGYDENVDAEAFWTEVLARVLAEGSARGL
jgi:hypothetical protein